ncbi:MAG: glycosyltransferase [Saprospiraceae bacterium]|nr:glycosyltransferase [Saprospiraceae bacterium]
MDGESIAINYLSKSLVELNCEITLLSMNTSKHYYTPGEKLPDELAHYHAVHYVDVNNEITVKGAFLNLFSGDSYHVSRYHSKKFSDQLIKLLKEEKFDIIHLETLYLTQFIDIIRMYSDALIVLRSHNVEFEIWERLTDNQTSFFKKIYLEYLTKKLKRFELKMLKEIDLLLAITQRDLKTFRSYGYLKAAKVIPIGLDTSDYLAEDKSVFDHPSISFIGSLDWIPNMEGLEWFLNDIWPRLLENHPKLTFHVAGRNMPSSYLERKIKNVYFHGEVDDAKAFINSHPITVVPLLSGSGMRVKILEGMFLGRIVITTALGLEGIDAHHKNQVLIAETTDEFVSAINFCFEHPMQTQNISHRAQVFAARNYDNLEIGKELLSFYKMKHEVITT